MSSVQRALVTLVAILVVCQCVPRPRDVFSAGFPRHGYENSVGSLCRVICARKDVSCPPECAFTDLDMLRKRSDRVNRSHSFGDNRMEDDSGTQSFDDYLFMKLMGRNLGDQD